jgi:hypothetical protein
MSINQSNSISNKSILSKYDEKNNLYFNSISENPLKIEFKKVFYLLPLCFLCGIVSGACFAMMISGGK